MSIKSGNQIVDEITDTVSIWPISAAAAGRATSQIESIRRTHRLV